MYSQQRIRWQNAGSGAALPAPVAPEPLRAWLLRNLDESYVRTPILFPGADREHPQGVHVLQPQVHPARAARGRARGVGRRGVPAGGARRQREATAPGCPTGPKRRSTSSWRTRSGRSSPTAATPSIRTATTATRCCPSSRSCATRTATSPSAARRSAACCTACCRCPAGAIGGARHLRAPGPARAAPPASSSGLLCEMVQRRDRPTTSRWWWPATSTTGAAAPTASSSATPA